MGPFSVYRPPPVLPSERSCLKCGVSSIALPDAPCWCCGETGLVSGSTRDQYRIETERVKRLWP